MSNTPIYDQVSELQKAAHRNGAFKLKVSVLNWVEAEIVAGRLKRTVDVEKIIKGIEGIKTWEENTAQAENQSTGSGTGTTSKTSGTPSKSRSSSASSKKSAGSSRRSSTEASKK